MRGIEMGFGLVLLACAVGSAWAAPAKTPPKSALTREAINAAAFPDVDPATTGALPKAKSDGKGAKAPDPDPLIVKVQVLLDRARISPGAIDGRDGDNYRGALAAFAAAHGLPATGRLDRALLDALQATNGEPAAIEYTITEEDVKGPFETIPPKLEDQAKLKAMAYTTTREMLAERFHMQRDLLSALNPDRPLDKPGTVITVAAVTPLGTGAVDGKADGKDDGRKGSKAARAPLSPKVVRIEVDKDARRLRAYGEDGALVGDYPASIGSDEKPAPSGSTKATRVAFDPWYTYNPKYRFKGVRTSRPFKIAPGPNSPVGAVWIDLAIPSYGIHGTPEPEKVGKTESHGCIRLTNWDARDLASHVDKNAKVEFLGE